MLYNIYKKKKKNLDCEDGKFACNSNDECVIYDRFCDAYADCSDKSDEPLGCEGPCRSNEKACR